MDNNAKFETRNEGVLKKIATTKTQSINMLKSTRYIVN